MAYTLGLITDSSASIVEPVEQENIDELIQRMLTPPTIYKLIILYYNGRKIKEVCYLDVLRDVSDKEAYRRFTQS